jgi:exosome complex component CSL4
MERKVTPGDRIGSIREVTAGSGTYARGTHVYASLVGIVGKWTSSSVIPLDGTTTNTIDMDAGAKQTVISVIPLHEKPTASSQVLSVGQTVLGRIVRVNTQQAAVEIVAAGNIHGTLKDVRSGVIRKEDVKSGPTEDVLIYDSFRPGDFVLAKVISLGDSKRYFLSTAEAELGVIRARCSTSGNYMVPVNYKEMECPESKAREPRKCAKPSDANGSYTFLNAIRTETTSPLKTENA